MTSVPFSASRPVTREHLDAMWTGVLRALGSLGDPAIALAPPGPRLPAKAPAAHEISVLVGLSGAVEGQLLVGFSRAQALALCSRALCVPLETFDATASAALAEIASGMAEACCEELERAGWAVSASMPSVIAGADVRVSWPAMYIQEGSFRSMDQSAYLALGLRLDQRI